MHQSTPSNSGSGCPMHQPNPASNPSTSGCPVQHASAPKSSGGCLVEHSSTGLNPLNQMPSLPQTPLDSHSQSAPLPTDRTLSSIPRGTEDGKTQTWEYPSPQQFYNALVRKGWETPTEHVEVMVDIHNFLNERAWNEVLRWEKRVAQPGDEQPHLARFKGRPGEMSPKAQFWMFMGWLLPTRFNTEPPFDRHDWVVRRPRTGEEVRYVIDYYSAPPTPDGEPVFALDVRPALDSFESARERVSVGMNDIWETMRERGWGNNRS
ncbi:cytochrome c/c1 heme-lyase [Pisolithus orientalis]|uniref:cytochrome c/c1 heme-lyase n=1 Tax=Pisolithus orientalis TaxID=936130 RepID=UPI002224CD37|nr:cytochrome c/c1 heme-lyase [Pisolithus orientalis]KAI5992372.1 cytochrome c/c1 heme-lyase [Pisolithus orientalis]